MNVKLHPPSPTAEAQQPMRTTMYSAPRREHAVLNSSVRSAESHFAASSVRKTPVRPLSVCVANRALHSFCVRHLAAKLRCALTSVLFAVVMLLVGCSDNGPADGVVRLKMGHVYELKNPTHAFGAAHLNERLQQADVGLEFSVYPAAQLGSEAELLEQLVAGELDVAIAGPSFLAMWHPAVGVFDAAYVFRDLEHMLEIADGDVMAPHWEEFRRRFGVRVLGTWAYGVRHITGNVPIRHPDDLKGFRLRLPDAAVWQASGKALGASPMPIAFSEVYMALQQGIADGQENPVPVIQAKGFQEVQKYLSLTGHINSSIQVLINDRSWQRLSAAQQQALQQTVQDLGRDVLQGIRKQEAELLTRWKQDGTMQIIEDVDVPAFEQRSREFFSSGFPFSPLYLKIASDRPASSGTSASQGNAVSDEQSLESKAESENKGADHD